MMFMPSFVSPRKHLKDVHETYFSHAWFAIKWGFFLILIGIASLIHAIFPFLFAFTAPRGVIRIYKIIQKRGELYRILQSQNENS